MASEMYVDTIAASDGTSPATLTKQSAAKGWVNFNGTGTIAILDSENFTSLVDDGTGTYTANYTNNMSDTYPAKTYSADGNNSTNYARIATMTGAASASNAKCATHISNTTTKSDMARVNIVVHGDLA